MYCVVPHAGKGCREIAATHRSDRVINRVNDNSSQLNVLVLGATGLIGNAVARELIQRGHNVTGTCRRQSGTARNLDELSMRLVYGDIDSPGCLDEWVAGHDVVVDAAAPYPLHLMYTSEGRQGVTVAYAKRRTETLIDSLRRHDAKLVYVSTLLARPGNPGAGLSHMQRRVMRTLHPYFAVKSTIEQRLDDAGRSLPGVIIIQPSACVGPYDIKPREQCIVPKFARGELVATISHDLNVIDSRDVALGIAAAIDNDRYGQTITLTGHNTSIGEILSEIEQISGVPAPRWQYPAALSVLPTYCAEFVWSMVGQPSPMPSLLPILVSEQGWTDMGEMQRELELMPRPLSETMRDTIDWYRKLGYC